MPINPKLLEILLCPVTGKSLQVLSDDELDEVNTRISDGRLNHDDGSPVTVNVEAGLITTDKARIYKVESDIPIMLRSQSIPVSDL